MERINEVSDIELGTHIVSNIMHKETESGPDNLNNTTLLAMATDPNHQHSLMRYCLMNSTTLFFLRVTANFWPCDGNWRVFDRCYFGLARFGNAANIIMKIIHISSLWQSSSSSATIRDVSTVIGIASIVRTVSVLIVQYVNQCRIQRSAHAPEILVVEESARIAGNYGLVVLLTNVISTMLLAFSSVPTNAGAQASEYFLGAYLSFNLFFLILDVKASSVLLDQLHLLADDKSLTLDVFVSSKADIHDRVKESRCASDLLVIPCIASAAGILVVTIYFLNTPAPPGQKIEASAFVCALLKELLFVVVAFWYVAKVNARADELTIKLSRSMWGTSSPAATDICSANSTGHALSHRKSRVCTIKENPENGTVQTSDIHRLSIHASCATEPISFTLLFKRVSWKNVAVSAVSFILAILIAIVKKAVEDSVEI